MIYQILNLVLLLFYTKLSVLHGVNVLAELHEHHGIKITIWPVFFAAFNQHMKFPHVSKNTLPKLPALTLTVLVTTTDALQHFDTR